MGSFDQLSEGSASGFEIVLQPQHGQRDFLCVRSCETNHPNASASRRRGDGDDGVVKIHEEIVAVLLSSTAA
jgi:hypothetical protein